MTGLATVFDVGWPVVDGDHVPQLSAAATDPGGPGFAHCSTGTQVTRRRPDEAPGECFALSDVDGAVNRLMGQAHRRVVRVLKAQPPGDLLG